MFILYPDIVLSLREDKYGNTVYIHHNDNVNIFDGEKINTYIVNISDSIKFFKISEPFNTENEITVTPSAAYNFFNQDKTFDSFKYSHSELTRSWMLYSVENQQYYYEGDLLYISSRSLRLRGKKVIFSKVTIEHDKTKVIFIGDNNYVCEMFNSNYNGAETPIIDLNNGIPFYCDIHCEPKSAFGNLF